MTAIAGKQRDNERPCELLHVFNKYSKKRLLVGKMMEATMVGMTEGFTMLCWGGYIK